MIILLAQYQKIAGGDYQSDRSPQITIESMQIHHSFD